MDYRIERDSMGEVRVPADQLWGAQTQRSLENFRIKTELLVSLGSDRIYSQLPGYSPKHHPRLPGL